MQVCSATGLKPKIKHYLFTAALKALRHPKPNAGGQDTKAEEPSVVQALVAPTLSQRTRKDGAPYFVVM